MIRLHAKVISKDGRIQYPTRRARNWVAKKGENHLSVREKMGGAKYHVFFLTLSAWNYDARVESPAAAASSDRPETLFCAVTAATAQRFPRSPCSFSPPLCAAAQNGRSKHGSRSSGGGGSLCAPRPSFWRAKTDRLHRIAESKLVPNYCSGALLVANWLINERLLH